MLKAKGCAIHSCSVKFYGKRRALQKRMLHQWHTHFTRIEAHRTASTTPSFWKLLSATLLQLNNLLHDPQPIYIICNHFCELWVHVLHAPSFSCPCCTIVQYVCVCITYVMLSCQSTCFLSRQGWCSTCNWTILYNSTVHLGCWTSRNRGGEPQKFLFCCGVSEFRAQRNSNVICWHPIP